MELKDFIALVNGGVGNSLQTISKLSEEVAQYYCKAVEGVSEEERRTIMFHLDSIVCQTLYTLIKIKCAEYSGNNPPSKNIQPLSKKPHLTLVQE